MNKQKPDIPQNGNVSPQLIVFTGHANLIIDIAFSPDGLTIASISYDGSVILWDVASGEIKRKLPVPVNLGNRVDYSPDGRFIVASSCFDSWLWDANTGELVRDIQGLGEVVSFTASGSLIFMPYEAFAVVYEAVSGKQIQVFPKDTVAAFSSDSSILATNSESGNICIWDTKTWKLTKTIKNELTDIRVLKFTHDGARLAAGGDDRTICLWDVKSGDLLQSFAGYQCIVRRVSFLSDRQGIEVLYEDGVGAIWDGSHSYTQISTPFMTDDSSSADIEIAEDGTVEIQRFKLPAIQGESPVSALFSPDGSKLAIGYDGFLVVIWDAYNGKVLHKLETCGDYAHCLVFSPDGKTLAVGTAYDDTVQLFSVKSGREKRKLKGHCGDISSVAFSPSGKLLASGAEDGTVKLWNPPNGKLLVTLMRIPEKDSNDWIVFAPDGYFDSSPGAEDYIKWQIGYDILPVEAYSEQFRCKGLLGEYIKLIGSWGID